jgi:hypothetical protein
MPDTKLHAPVTSRNREPRLAALSRVLPPVGLVLEISSGTGEHAVAFAMGLPGLEWQPSDIDPRSVASIAAHREESGPGNLRPPLILDASTPDWPVTHAEAVVCVNMIHIAPWTACSGLMAGAARILPADGVLYLYGPFKENGSHGADSNARFDIDLRSRDPAWGVRDIEAVIALAAENGLRHAETAVMPANNRSVVFRRSR